MRWALRIFLLLLLLVIAIPVGVVIALNSATGRNFVTQQINQLAGGLVHIAGLGGHFPADIKIAALSVADTQGVWLTGTTLELRWVPLDILSRELHVTALTAAEISVARAPAPGKTQSTNANGGGIPNIHVAVDRLAIGKLNLSAALAGAPVTLGITGATHLQSQTQGDITLDAQALNGQGDYRLNAAIDNQTINTTLHVAEPPDGLLGHYAGPQVHDPLSIDLTLAGPRDDAALNFTAALGAAKLNGTGTIGLNPDAPKADVTFTVPSLAPVAAIAGQNIGGSTSLHLVAHQQDNATEIALDGHVALTQAPGPAAKLVGPDGQFLLLVKLADNTGNIENLNVTGAGFGFAAHGTVAQSGINLATHLTLKNAGTLSPGLSGSVTEDGTVTGTAQDFALAATLSGDVTEPSVPSGPFNIAINVQHLPSLPTGTLTGTGALEGFPLLLNAAFARDEAGNATVKIAQAKWRSLDAQADLALAKDANLPTGSAKFAITRLADFAKFSPLPLAGSVNGNFAHQDAENFSLNINAQNLIALPSLGAINAKLNASGPLGALAVKLTATINKLIDAPAQIAANAVVNLDAQSVALSSFTAGWKTLNAKLLGPASIETKPGIAVRHLALDINGGSIKIDGVLSPSLNLNLAVQNLPANLAALAAPGINLTGTLDATAALTGSQSAPSGKLTFAAHDIKAHAGPAAALPAANLSASATLASKAANISAKLGIGPNVDMNASGLVPLTTTGKISVHLTGTTDLRLLDPITAAQGSTLRGIITPDITVTGTASAPLVNGTVMLTDGSVQNIGSGLNLTKISAHILAAGKFVTLQDLSATAGHGTITGHGTADLRTPKIPVDFSIAADNATPVASDIVTENLDAALTLKGELQGALALAGKINIRSANINIPKSLPPSVVALPILNRGEKPPPPPPPPPNVTLDLLIRAHNQIFVRGDGLFAELGGKVQVSGTAANPDPQGGFTLIRGNFALGGKTLQFTKGVVSFNGDGFIPSLDLEASTTTTTNTTATLVIGGTADKPTITLTSSPTLPSDEVLSQLLFGQATQSLSPFQAASLAAALASLSGVGGSSVSDPLGGVRNALGLDQLSLGGGQNGGAPSLQAGRYVAPGIYVGAEQSTSGQGTKATVEINLYKGLKLNTATGTSSGGSGNSSSVGLTYQFNY